MMIRAATILLLASGSAACNTEQPAGVSEPPPAARTAPSGLSLVPLRILSGGRTHEFTVEVAATPEQQAQGLMFRESLGPNEGMIFPFPAPKPASFWMKNTLIPLDMIFIRPDGTIGRIAVNTVPKSLEPVAFNEPTAAVLELAGGRSVQLGLKAGDRVTWPGTPSARP
jgi:uncharacterized membrane protein (UPF0127 family)